MVARADREAQVSGQFVAAITHQDAAFAEFVADGDGAITYLTQDEIGLALYVGNLLLFEPDLKQFTGG